MYQKIIWSWLNCNLFTCDLQYWNNRLWQQIHKPGTAYPRISFLLEIVDSIGMQLQLLTSQCWNVHQQRTRLLQHKLYHSQSDMQYISANWEYKGGLRLEKYPLAIMMNMSVWQKREFQTRVCSSCNSGTHIILRMMCNGMGNTILFARDNCIAFRTTVKLRFNS